MANEKTVLAGVERDLERIGRLDPELVDGALAAAAIVVAKRMDDPSNSATSISMCSRALVDVMTELRDLAPEGEEKDGLDDLSARRAARRGGAEAAG